MMFFTYYFWSFMLGSFLGVVVEMFWCFIKYNKIESRKGVIYGPFNPLYGFAAAAISFIINSITNKSLGYIFLLGVITASVIEYISSYLQEKITGTVSWDYKDFKYNLGGRINLGYSILWGFITLAWYIWCMPIIDYTQYYLYKNKIFTIVTFVFMFINCIISFLAALRRNERKKNIAAHTKIQKHIDYFYNDELMDKIYPNSTFVSEEILEK